MIAVTGAAGAYGGYVVQFSKADGLTVIADASDKRWSNPWVPICRGDDFTQRIRQHFPNGVDGLADGAVLKEKVIPAVKDGAAFTSVRGFEGVRTHSIRFSATYVWDYTFEHDKLDRLRQFVDEGKITLRVAAPYKPEGHSRLEARGTRGRIVITF
ncbi:MAG TPA: hypothetical protein VHS97_06530 [Isosphaeraceae bacterium]|nr:hypothetical protein [Isosphaeraceae bacterium]